MQRTEAARWFWPFMLIAALAATVVIGLSASVQPRAMQSEPEFRMQIAVVGHQTDIAERTSVSIEPARIEVVGTRAPSILERLAALLPQRKPAS